MMRSRWVKVMVALLVGVVVNIALAWVCAMDLDPASGIGARWTWPSSRPAVWPGPVPAHWPADVPGARTVAGVAWTPLRHISIRSKVGRSTELMSEGPNTNFYQYHMERFGWPFRALRRDYRAEGAAAGGGSFVSTITPVEGWRGGLKLGLWPKPRPGLPAERMLPIAPVFPGLVLNSLWYSCVAVLLYRAKQAITRRSQLKPGECVKCRYLVADLPQCPECGAPNVRGAAGTTTG